MARKPPPDTNRAIIKKLGATMRDRTTDIVSEELPDDIRKLLERMRDDASKPKS
jgi:hypothetical protein